MDSSVEGLRQPPRVARAFARLSAPHTAPRWVVDFHRWEYLHSGGRFGYGVFGAPILQLHTTGRLTGERRMNPLVFALDARRVVVVASNEGRHVDPNWLLNLEAFQEAELWLGRRHRRATSQIVRIEHSDYQRLWILMNKVNYGRHEHMQAKTMRPIPIIRFSPIL
jgi:F420H(2)-dependent quinone reductase